VTVLAGAIVVDSGVYGALANVAAITTALQSIVSLLPLQRAIDLESKTDTPGTADYNDAKDAARRDFLMDIVLCLIAFVINASVLAAWFKVGVYIPDLTQWEYWLPWFAVFAGFLALSATAAYALRKLRGIANLP
jgi:hypothetical protein